MKLSPLALGTAAVVGLVGVALYRKAKTALPAGNALPDESQTASVMPSAKPTGRQFVELTIPVLLVAGGVYAFRKLA